MATANFTECGNHGLFVIECENEFDYADTVENIVSELASKGFSVDKVNLTDGDDWAVYDNNGRGVALITAYDGYYSGVSFGIFTGDDMVEEFDPYHEYDDKITRNKKTIDKVVRCVTMYTTPIRRVATFSSGETIYERIDK